MVPQPRVPGRVTRATFMDEEIRGLAAKGVKAYILSTELPEDTQSGSVWLKSVPARRSFANRVQASRLLVRPIAGLPVPNWADPRMWYRCGWLEHVAAQVVHEENIDLIHSHFAWPNGQGGMIVRALTGRPLVAAFRGNDLLISPEIGYGARHRPAFDRAVRGLLGTAERTLYFSQVMRNKGIELGAAPGRATVLHKGVDIERFGVASDRAALRHELGFGGKPMIMTVAGLIARKGVEDLLAALARLRDDLDFTFVIVGDGPERENLADLSVRLQLADRTVFTGRLDRQTIPKYFAACDVFVLASLVEAAGNVVLEAMSAGRPAVCTDSGGPGEFVVDGQTGFVVPVGDAAAIASRVKLLLQDTPLSERLGAAGRRRAVDEYSYDRMTGDIIAIYREVLSERSRKLMAAC
jgi:glycosyltransferase involved in cell wall biosynthesis